MTTVVQTVAANGLAGVASKTFTLTATGTGNSLVISIAVEAGSTGYTGFTITDSTAGSNTYSNAALLVSGARIAAIYYCLAPTSGVTSVTITGTGGTGGMFGCAAVQEVSGLTALDKHNTGSAPASSPMTLNNSGANAAAVAFVASAISVGNGATNCGISDPPSGYLTSAISQNDSADGSGACCYRIDSSAVTDTVIWAATSWLPTAPAAIASFSGSAAAAKPQAALNRDGPGVSPNARQTFRARSLSSITSPNVTAGLTGQASSFSSGTVSAANAVTLTGQAAALAAGQIIAVLPAVGASVYSGPGISPDYRQLFRPRTLSSTLTATSDVTVGLTGQAAGFSLGTVGPSSSVPAAGASISSSVGSVLAASQIIVTGQSAGTAAGTIVPSAQRALTGQGSTLSSGTVVPGLQVTLVGQAATFASGTLALGSTVVLTGQSASFTAGNLVASGGGNVTLALIGQSAAFTAGTLLPSSSVALTGQAITSSAGVIAPARSLAFTGQSAIFAAGNLLPSSAVGVTGQSATFAPGNVTAPNGVTLALTGQAASFTGGSTTPSATVGLAGQSITSSAGTLAAANAHALAGSAITSTSGTLLGSFAVALVGQQAVFTSGIVLPPGDKTASLTGSVATFHAGTVLGIGAILTGTPRYVVRRQQKRMFTVSSVTYSQFPPKDTAEAVKLEFDFSPDLDAGVLLSGTPVVTVTVSGADPAPVNILNGLPRFDATSTQVIVPVMGGVANCDYDVKVVVPTTDSLTVLALSGILPVRA